MRLIDFQGPSWGLARPALQKGFISGPQGEHQFSSPKLKRRRVGDCPRKIDENVQAE